MKNIYFTARKKILREKTGSFTPTDCNRTFSFVKITENFSENFNLEFF